MEASSMRVGGAGEKGGGGVGKVILLAAHPI